MDAQSQTIEQVSGRPVTDFDHHIPDGQDPEPLYADLRRKCPVVWTEKHGGYWIVSRYEDVCTVLKNHAIFSSTRNDTTGDELAISQPPMPMKLNVPEEMDPPEFFPYKRLLSSLMSPQAVENSLASRARHWVDWHIDAVIEVGECDIVRDLASPVATAVALEFLGFPQSDWRRMSHAHHDIVGMPPGSKAWQAALESLAWIDERIACEIAIRQKELAEGRIRDDAMGQLVAAHIDGAPMATEMAESTVRLVIAGGVDTTANAMTSALIHLHAHRGQRQQLIDNPELWMTATDEFIRRYPPVLAHARTVAQDTEVGGCPMKAGDRIIASEASACWDEDAFPNADQVVLDRFPNRHVAFGLGIHRCPGMHIARVSFRYLVGQVIERMPDYLIDTASLKRYAEQSAVSGWVAVPTKFTPGKRKLACGM
jgi:cytochrome P450